MRLALSAAAVLALAALKSGTARAQTASAQPALPAVTGRAVADVWTVPPAELERLVHALPLYATEKNGRPVLAINVVFLGAGEQLRAAARRAGWFEVGRSFWGDLKQGFDDLHRRRRLEHFPPFSVLYVAGRPEDLNEVRATGLTSRHHFRLWRQPATDSEGRRIWAAAADYDQGVDWRSLDHVGSPDIDKERDFLAATLRGCPQVERLSLIPRPGLPASSFKGERHFRTDRRVLVVELRPAVR